MKRWLLIFAVLAANAGAQSGRIYTAPDPSTTGGITGTVPVGELTHVLAIDQERVKVFRGTSSGGQFRLEHLPVGKYDLVLVTKERGVYEGVRLGEAISSMSTGLRTNLETRIALADSFFNRYKVHRCGVDGGRVLALVERLRDRLILQQSGAKLEANVRRLEVIELEQATDDWQMIQSRHLYREGEPIEKSPPFFQQVYVAGLSGIRVVDRVKDLGTVTLPKD